MLMKIFQKLFAFYIDGSIHLALAVLAFLAITQKKFGLVLPLEYWTFVFFGTITAYNFVKYPQIVSLHYRSLEKSLKVIQIFSAICFIVLVLFLFKMKIQTLLYSLGFAILTLFYAIPFYHHKNLRMLSGVKIFIVALVWAGVTVIIPMIASQNPLTWDVWITFFQRGFLVLALIMPFEIRDMHYDADYLNTIPQRIGVKNTKVVGILAIAVSVGFEFLKVKTYSGYNLSFAIFIIALTILMLFSEKRQSRYYASFWVESLPILWWAVYIIF